MITRESNTIGMNAGAVFSECLTYRHRLWRIWDDGLPKLGGLFANPSIADETKLDPTLTRFQQRAIRLGYGGIEVVNMLPLVETFQNKVTDHPDPLGSVQDADFAILDALKDCHVIICGWGNHKSVRDRAQHVLSLLNTAGLADRLHALKVNQDGSPQHPLYLPYSLQPVRYSF